MEAYNPPEPPQARPELSMPPRERTDERRERPPDAAGPMLRARFDDVLRELERAVRRASPRRLQKLRTATRRAMVAVEVFAGVLAEPDARALNRRLNRIRRCAGRVRDRDVQVATIGKAAAGADGPITAAMEHLQARLGGGRRRLKRRLRRHLERLPREFGWAMVSMEGGAQAQEYAARELSRLGAEADAAGRGDLADPRELHRLRVALRSLRYGAELFGPSWRDDAASPLIERLKTFQELTGAVHDASIAVERVRKEGERLRRRAPDSGPDPLGRGLEALARRGEALLHRRHEEALAALDAQGVRDVLDQLRRLVGALRPAISVVGNGSGGQLARGDARANGRHNHGGQRRFAALDIGTNSIRLSVVEVDADGSYRLIADDKEPTRLGRGVATSGRLRSEAMERSVRAIGRMRETARACGVPPGSIRIVGTSAVREAENREEFLELLRDRAGVEVEVLSPEAEGRLAFVSASHAMDLTGVVSAVVDVGGGSTEIVLASGGVIQEVCSVPLGAVRLTEMFGGAEESSGARYQEMRRHIARELRRGVGRPRLKPRLVAGTGGTFAALGAMLARRESLDGGPMLWSRGMPGIEASRPRIEQLIGLLRGLPLAGRESVPGLHPDRADIIVAGLVIAERVLKHLGAPVVRVQNRGIREGLIITMAAGDEPRGRGTSDRMRAVRRLAEECGYERPHSEHVTALALQIHDLLAAAVDPGGVEAWSAPAARRLLEAAATLHDIGCMIGYRGHHKHSARLIRRSDLSSGGLFTAREVAIVAAVARYHRRAEPSTRHAMFSSLAGPDRDLVRRLASILRVADGLDRTHSRVIRSVRVEVLPGAAVFHAESAGDPAADLAGAAHNAGLFEGVFGLRPEFRWGARPPEDQHAAQGEASPNELHAAASTS